MFLGSKVWRVHRADNLTPSVSQLSKLCKILNISQPYRPPRPVMGIALLFYLFYPEDGGSIFPAYQTKQRHILQDLADRQSAQYNKVCSIVRRQNMHTNRIKE
jgi:hypothetical protein